MFYLLHKKKLLTIHDNNTYTTCKDCGKLMQIDLQEALSGGGDLYQTYFVCEQCMNARGKSQNNLEDEQ